MNTWTIGRMVSTLAVASTAMLSVSAAAEAPIVVADRASDFD